MFDTLLADELPSAPHEQAIRAAFGLAWLDDGDDEFHEMILDLGASEHRGNVEGQILGSTTRKRGHSLPALSTLLMARYRTARRY